MNCFIHNDSGTVNQAKVFSTMYVRCIVLFTMTVVVNQAKVFSTMYVRCIVLFTMTVVVNQA